VIYSIFVETVNASREPRIKHADMRKSCSRQPTISSIGAMLPHMAGNINAPYLQDLLLGEKCHGVLVDPNPWTLMPQEKITSAQSHKITSAQNYLCTKPQDWALIPQEKITSAQSHLWSLILKSSLPTEVVMGLRQRSSSQSSFPFTKPCPKKRNPGWSRVTVLTGSNGSLNPARCPRMS
jgi:hypothetical protein